MITISLCMIVKNEENVLKRCLDSLVSLVDEIIIVDTGSSDKTKEIALSYTDNVYDYEWNDDFSAARNFSFSKASKEYIYCADADEVIDASNQKRFLQLKQVLLPEIEIVQMYYCNQLSQGSLYNFDKELRPKLYKRVRSFHFTEWVHEAVSLEPVVYDSEIEIQHLPESLHASRDFKIFEKMRVNKIPFSRRLQNMYAKELFFNGSSANFLSAIPVFLETWEKENVDADQLLEASCVLARAYRLANEEGNFFKYALKNVAAQGCSELMFELGEYFYSLKDYREASIWYYNAVYETTSVLNIHYGGDYSLRALAECYEKLGDKEMSTYYLQQASVESFK